MRRLRARLEGRKKLTRPASATKSSLAGALFFVQEVVCYARTIDLHKGGLKGGKEWQADDPFRSSRWSSVSW